MVLEFDRQHDFRVACQISEWYCRFNLNSWFYYILDETSDYGDIIMSAMASQITSRTIICSIVYSGVDQRKHQSSESLAFVRGIHVAVTGEFPTQRASNAENVSIWWRHHTIWSSSHNWVSACWLLMTLCIYFMSNMNNVWLYDTQNSFLCYQTQCDIETWRISWWRYQMGPFSA